MDDRRTCHPLDRIEGCEACRLMRLAAADDDEPEADDA